MIFLIFFWNISCLVYSFEKDEYSGFRMTIDKNILYTKYTDLIEKSFHFITNKEMKWKDLSYQIINKPFSIDFILTNIQCVDTKFNKISILTKQITDISPEIGIHYKFDGKNIANFTFQAEYAFRVGKSNIFKGKINWIIHLNSLELLHKFTGQLNSTIQILNSNFGTQITEFNGFNLFGLFTKWTLNLINGNHIQNLLNIITILIQHEINSFYLENYFKIKTIHNPNGSLNLTLISDFHNIVEIPSGFLTFYTNSNLTIEKRPYFKTLSKFRHTIINLATYRCQICIGSNLLPHFIDLFAKTREYVFSIDPKDIGLKGTMQDLINIMPSLINEYNPDDEIYIGCRVPPEDSIRMLKSSELSKTEIATQIPVNCIFGPKNLNIPLLSVTLYIRVSMEKNLTIENLIFVLRSTLKWPKLYNFKINFYLGELENIDMLTKILSKITTLIDGHPVFDKGFKINLPYNPSSFSYEMNKEELCFNYL